MDEYVDYISENPRHVGSARIARQKALEERIVKPFRLPPEPRALS
jgi:hypothetical protein